MLAERMSSGSRAAGVSSWLAPGKVLIVRWASGVTRIRHRPVGGGPGITGVSNRTPSERMSWAKIAPSWSSATWPTNAALRPSAAAPAMLLAAEPPLTSRPGPIAP